MWKHKSKYKNTREKMQQQKVKISIHPQIIWKQKQLGRL